MSVDVPVFTPKTKTDNPHDIYSYGYAFTSGDLDEGVLTLAKALPNILKLSEQENAAQLMASEIEKTRNILRSEKQKLAKLDENERSSQTRLMKVKDLMLKEMLEAK